MGCAINDCLFSQKEVVDSLVTTHLDTMEVHSDSYQFRTWADSKRLRYLNQVAIPDAAECSLIEMFRHFGFVLGIGQASDLYQKLTDTSRLKEEVFRKAAFEGWLLNSYEIVRI